MNRPGVGSWTSIGATVWILLSAGWSAGVLLLSSLGHLNRPGNAVLLLLGVVASIVGYYRLNGNSWAVRGWRWRRFKRLFPLLYVFCALGALVGGAIHPPTNHDALSYRVPRLLHWLSTEQWHWIGGVDNRMDFSGIGFEVLMLPPLAALHTLRFAFLINVVSYLLMPGLVFSVFSALGIKRSIAATWMWILPCASCFVMQAGSIGNDFLPCIYVLTALMFGLRAIRSGKRMDVILAVLSAALMTSVKASSLPLLLPIAIIMAVVFFKHRSLIVTAAITGCFAASVSFLPIAVANTVHTGDWAGVPDSPLKITNPVVGLAGNAIILGSASLAPAVFPQAEKVNSGFNREIAGPALSWIKEGFVDFRMTHPQLASEEHSGLGIGVSSALLLGFCGSWRRLRFGRLYGLGGMVAVGFWVGLLFYMIKLGNCGAPRLISPYYAGLFVLPLLLIESGRVFTRRWWRWASLVLLMPILPALVVNPARPLLPMQTLVEMLKEKGIGGATLTRMGVVYEVYAKRYDVYQPVRELLPEDARSIAFAGTSAESEYSFWLPLGSRRVTDFTPRADGELPDTKGFDVIVASGWGSNGRFGMTPQQLADRLDWKIIATTEVRSLASTEPDEWCVLVPKLAE